MPTNRRDFLGGSAATFAALGLRAAPAMGMSTAGGAQPGWIHPIGLQLYTVRDAMQRDLEGTLARVAQIGYREVELAGTFGRSAPALRSVLDRNGLAAPSAHVSLPVLEADPVRAMDDAHVLGHKYLVVPWLPAEERKTLDQYRLLADRLNRLGARLKGGGLTLAYHNHDFEFKSIDGQLPYDVLLTATDPRYVKLEIDLYWMIHGGQDPLDYFSRWRGRVRLVHVKDTYGPPDGAMADVGAGVTDWRKLFAEWQKVGIEHFIVEHDEPADAFASAAASFNYLSRLQPGAATAPIAGDRLKQSVTRGTIDVPLPELCTRAKDIGLAGIDLLYREDWQMVREAGLTCAMGYASHRADFIANGFNDLALHNMLVDELTQAIPLAAQAGVPNLIAMFGNRRGRSDEEGIANCIAGLSKVAPLAEQHGVNICLELLNSKVDHKDYQGDRSAFGTAVVQGLNSPRVKLLFDIYHMQIMEGDVIRTIRDHVHWIGHFHTAGVPGRHEINATQELNYHAVALAIANAGYSGFIAHEFRAHGEPFAALADAFRICSV